MTLVFNLYCLILWVLYINPKEVKSEDTCGHSPGFTVAGKIVGGYDVGYLKYPWFVSLYKNNMPNCGATLIGKRAVLTAAHCFDQYRDNPDTMSDVYILVIGAYNICDTSESTQKRYEVQKVFIHEKYYQEDPFYDIALLMLKKDVDGVEPACLPSKPVNDADKPLDGYITGFGYLKYQGFQTSCIQQEARIKIYNDTTCKSMIATVDEEINNFKWAFCAGYLEGGIDGCQGDSGGPLMVISDKESRFVLLGVTSFGYKCAIKDLLGVYTDVSQYLDWINEKTGETNGDNSSTPSDEYDDEEESDDNEEQDDDNDDDENDEENGESSRAKKKKTSKAKNQKNKAKTGKRKKKLRQNVKGKNNKNDIILKNSPRTKTFYELIKMLKKCGRNVFRFPTTKRCKARKEK